MYDGAVATSPAVSSNNSRLRGRWSASPKVLLLDEPTEGIQPNVIQQIGDVLSRLVAERGLAIVMVEQYLEFVKEIGDRFYLMDRRRVVASGLTADLTTDLVTRHLTI